MYPAVSAGKLLAVSAEYGADSGLWWGPVRQADKTSPPNVNLHQTAVDGAYPFVHCFVQKYGEKQLHGDTEPGKQLRR